MAPDPRGWRIRTVDLRLLPAAAGAWAMAIAGGGRAQPAAWWFWTAPLAALLIAGAVRGVAAGVLPGSRVAHRHGPAETGRKAWFFGCAASLALAWVGGALVAVPGLVVGGDPVEEALAEAGERGTPIRAAVFVEPPIREVDGGYGVRYLARGTVREAQAGREVRQGSAAVTLWWNSDPRELLPAKGAPVLVVGTVDPARQARPAIAVAATLGTLPPASEQREDAGGPAWLAGLSSLLDEAKERTAERAHRNLSEDVAALVLGMAYGDDTSLSEGGSENMKVAGLSHLTAVSGSNVAVVFLLGVHSIRWTRCPRVLTILAGLGAVLGYLVLVGPEPSIARATVMGVLGGLGLACGRGGSAGSALWLSIVILLTIDPGMGTEAGFVLSVLATAGIIVQGPTACRLASLVMWRWLAEIVAITVTASLWCVPYLVHLAGFWGTYTVLANSLVAPVVPAATVCGLLAVILAWVAPLAEWAVALAGLCARWVECVSTVTAGLPGATVETGRSAWAVVGCAFIAVATAAIMWRYDPAWRTTMREMPDNLAASLAAEPRPPLRSAGASSSATTFQGIQ